METETGRRVLKQYLKELGCTTDSAVWEQISPYFAAFKALRNAIRQNTNAIRQNTRKVSNLLAAVESIDTSILALTRDLEKLSIENKTMTRPMIGQIGKRLEKLEGKDKL